MGSKENTWNIRLLWKVLFSSVKMSIVYWLIVYVHYLLTYRRITKKEKKVYVWNGVFFFLSIIYFLINILLQK